MKTISCKEISMEECDFALSTITLDDARSTLMTHIKMMHGEIKEDDRAAMMSHMETSWNQKPNL